MSDTLPSYAELCDALVQAGSLTKAAECHGVAVGQLCAARSFEPEAWFRHLFGADFTATSHITYCANLLATLAKETDLQLKSGGIELRLLLPEDGSLSERVAALAEWCQGFLLGISLARIGDLKALPPETNEFVEDLNAIARAGVSADDANEEEEERAYAEVLEYVRVGVLMLREDVLFGQR